MLRNLKYKHLYIKLALFPFILLFATALYAGDVTLTWDPPTTSADGTPLTDLAGYNVYYGAESGNYSQSIDAGNVITYQVTNLTDGQTYYLSVTAYDTSGNESEYSNEYILTVSGTGTSSPVPDITVTDSVGSGNDLQMPFENLTEWRSQDQVVTITNNGSANLDIGNIAQNNPVEEPFSILNDNCSWQTVIPSGKCTFTVRFSPATIGLFNDSFDIPSNDPDEDAVILTLSGTGLSSISNNPPSIPELIYPASGQKHVGTTIEFKWEKSTDPDGDPVTHYLYYSENTDFTNSAPITVASLENKDIYYAGIGNYGAGLLLFLIIPILTSIARKRRKILLLTVMVIVAGMLLVSCGEVADVISDIVPFIDYNSSGSHTVSGLNTGATYCWKVVAEDSGGEESESSMNCFETEQAILE